MKKGLKRLILGVVLFLTGVFVIPLLTILPVITGLGEVELFKVPGVGVVSVPEPGRYYLWNHHQAFHEGRSYNVSEYVPNGMHFEIVDAGGETLSLTSSTNFTIADRGGARRSIGHVDVPHAGEVTITVTGGNQEHLLSFSPSELSRIFSMIFGGLALSAATGVLGIILIIWGIVVLVRRPEPEEL